MNPLKKRPRTKDFNIPIEKPEWMKVRLPFPLPGNNADQVRSDIANSSLHTVCESASCPNLHHCWSRKTATYMLGGDICTRRCAYCDVASGKPGKLDANEPIRVAESVLKLGLRFVVLTAVNRDDLSDGGASHFADTVNEIRKRNKDIHIEVLIPDFKGKISSLETVFNSFPDIINHNIETVKSLFPVLAPSKKYDTSLSVLRTAHERNFTAKSGLILGMGESKEEVMECIQDLRNSGTEMLTIGQYLQPTPTHYPVKEYIQPEIFSELKTFAKKIGFKHVESGPLVRSSYHAEEQYQKQE